MAKPSITDLKMWVGTLFNKDDWDFNFSKIVSWFSDGNSDIVVNSIKTTNGIDLDGAQLTNLGPATSGSQAVTLDQANTILNRTSYFYPFSIASGKVDVYGNAAYLQKDSDTQITVLAGNINPDLVIIQSDGTIESLTSNSVITVPTTDGVYRVIKEKGQPITITGSPSNTVNIGRVFPAAPLVGDYYLNNTQTPFKGYKYTLNGWEETAFCFISDVVVSGGSMTPYHVDFNYNRYDFNCSRNSLIEMAHQMMPDYSSTITTGDVKYTPYTVPYDCFCIIIDGSNEIGTHYLYVNNTGFPFSYHDAYQYLQMPYGFMLLSRGDSVYTNVAASLQLIKIRCV